jgi:ABC-type glycerol-3-phosphate transport system permease component
MTGKFRKFVKESPKVATLLVFGALVLFPMYMMFSLSFMTPAQLERFPWFPLPIDVPRQIDAVRDGRVSMEPASLVIEPEDGSASTVLQVPVDRRFQLELIGADVKDNVWTAGPGDDGRVVVAQLQAANVWDVTVASEGREYLIDGEPFRVPEHFTTVLPGMALKARAMKELWIVDEARRQAALALAAADRVVQSPGDDRTRAEREASRLCLQAEHYAAAADRAMERARTLAAEALDRWHVSADEELQTNEQKLNLAHLNVGRAKQRAAEYLARHEAEVRPSLDVPDEAPTAALHSFRLDRRDVVAELVADGPARVTALSGTLTVATQWIYPRQRQRMLRIVLREGVAATGPEGRATVPGRPLADLVTHRDLTLIWTDGRWFLGEEELAALVPVGFEVTLPAGTKNGEARHLAAGTVIGTLSEPCAQATLTESGLTVGLALARRGANDRLETFMPMGEGRWAYDLRRTRDVPFAVRPLADRDEIAAAKPGKKIAEFFVNRARTITYDSELPSWVEKRDLVALTLPPGFAPTDVLPPEDGGADRSLAANTILGELPMPEARVTIDDDFLILSLTRSSWGSGQWAYPIGEKGGLETLQVVAADTPQMSRGGPPWELRPTDESVDELVDDKGRLRSDAALVVKTIRRTTLNYAGQRWHVDGRPVDLWLAAEALERQRDQYHQARTRADNFQRRVDEVRAKPESPGKTKELAALLEESTRIEGDLERRRRTLRTMEQAAGFRPLSGTDQVLATDQQSVTVEAGTVLAVMSAEQPYRGLLREDVDADLATRVEQRDDAWTVSFTHRLELPVTSNVITADGRDVVGGETLATFLAPQWLNRENYVNAWDYVRPFVLNTVITAVLTMVLSLFFASLSAFVFSRFQFPGKAVFYSMIIVLLMIPGVLNLVPLFSIVKGLQLLDQPLNAWGYLKAVLVLVLPAVAGGQIMNVYIMRNNLETLAKDLFDAARIDGASNFQTYWHIAVPLSRPIMGTLAIFALLAQWNNFIWPWTVIQQQEYMTVTAGLALLEGQNLSDYGLQMAGATLASLPLIVLFFFTMNLFIRGIQSGAIKA